jgi:hypothetical protein
MGVQALFLSGHFGNRASSVGPHILADLLSKFRLVEIIGILRGGGGALNQYYPFFTINSYFLYFIDHHNKSTMNFMQS